MSSKAVSIPIPALNSDAICLKKSGVVCSIASTLRSIKKNNQPKTMATGVTNPTTNPIIGLIPIIRNEISPRNPNKRPPKSTSVMRSDALTYIPDLIRFSCIITRYLSGKTLSRPLDTGDNAGGIIAIFSTFYINLLF